MITSNSQLDGILLIFLHVGFTCMEASCTKVKESRRSYLDIFLHLFFSVFIQWITGQSFEQSEGNFFVGVPAWPWTQNETSYATENDFLFKPLVQAIPVTILAGTVSEFCHPIAFLLNTILLTGVSQFFVEYWVRNPKGWLRKLDYQDFSGGVVIFGFAGASCFCARLFLPVRKKDYSEVHSTSLYSLGSMLVVVGFLVMNCGALCYTPHPENINSTLNKIARNTMLAGSGGCLVCALIAVLTMPKQHIRMLSYVVNGTFAGMISICAAADVYFFCEALLVGSIGAIFYVFINYLFFRMKEQDSNGALSVYLSGGLWSTLAPHIVTNNGFLFSVDKIKSLHGLSVSFAGTIAICTWAALWTAVVLLILKFFGLIKDGKFESPSRPNQQENAQNTEEYYIEALPYPVDERLDKGEISTSFSNNCVGLKIESNVYENLRSNLEMYKF